MTMLRRSTATRGGLVVALLVGMVPLVAIATPAAALPTTSTPSLSLVRTIRTTPFVGTSTSVKDGEGATFIANDPAHPNIGGTDSLWLADDNGDAAWEINPYTGALKSSVVSSSWEPTKQYNSGTNSGTGSAAGPNRDADFESLAYDATNDILYAFSGKCCKSSVLPTVFRLKRGADNTFHPDSWQALPSGTDYTAAAWHPGDHKVYVGVSSSIRTYDYATNTSGSSFSVSGVTGIYGMSFSNDGNDLFVANASERLMRANWNTKTLMTGWSISLTPFGIRDSRAIDLINDQFYVLDGYDGRSSSDPLNHAVFVLNACCGSTPAPVASFSAAQLASPNFTMQFTDTSSNAPTAWTWDFDNNGSTDSTAQHPTHTFSGTGDFLVRHTASNSGGGSPPITQSVHVNPPAPPTPPVANFTSAAAASPPLTIAFTDTSTNTPTNWAWDFNNDTVTDSTVQNPSNTFPAVGNYPVTLTASNGGGPSTVTKTVAVSSAPPTTLFNATADTYAAFDTPTTSYGTKTAMHGKLTSSNDKRPYVKFDVAGLQGHAVTSAKLRLFVTDPSPSGGDWYSVDPNWIETGAGALTWNTAPLITGTKLGTIGICATGVWVEVDVTAAVTAEGLVSFAMKATNTDTVYFATRETATAPQLVLTVS